MKEKKCISSSHLKNQMYSKSEFLYMQSTGLCNTLLVILLRLHFAIEYHPNIISSASEPQGDCAYKVTLTAIIYMECSGILFYEYTVFPLWSNIELLCLEKNYKESPILNGLKNVYKTVTPPLKFARNLQ